MGAHRKMRDFREEYKAFLREYPYKTNAQRFPVKTPCKETGRCYDCKSPDTICCQFLITRYSRHTDRIHVILVNDSLGL